MYFLTHLYETADRVIGFNTAKTDKFINITSAVSSDLPDEFGDTMMNE